MKRNYSTIRERMADAIVHELSREEGHWPAVKKKVRELLGSDVRHLQELYQLADACAASVLDCELLAITAKRRPR
jgi:hypothetical protein